jgi:hypothetical protein
MIDCRTRTLARSIEQIRGQRRHPEHKSVIIGTRSAEPKLEYSKNNTYRPAKYT